MLLNTFTSTCAWGRIGKLCTDDTTTATLSDHLLRCMLIAQEGAASVDDHQTVKVVDGRYAPFRGWLLGTIS